MIEKIIAVKKYFVSYLSGLFYAGAIGSGIEIASTPDAIPVPIQPGDSWQVALIKGVFMLLAGLIPVAHRNYKERKKKKTDDN